MKHLVVFSGAGMSAESGIKTFRDAGGLWENYDVMKVASIEGWYEDPALVLQFYNDRRTQLQQAQPNRGHLLLAELEQQHKVTVITQNVDDLHERAGSSQVLHLHGELTKACSSRDKSSVVDIGYQDISQGDKAADGSQLRPFIVWFGEAVPMMEKAVRVVKEADLFLIIGTSLQVYPAAGLIHEVKSHVPMFLIDPNDVTASQRIKLIKATAAEGMQIFKEILIAQNL